MRQHPLVNVVGKHHNRSRPGWVFAHVIVLARWQHKPVYLAVLTMQVCNEPQIPAKRVDSGRVTAWGIRTPAGCSAGVQAQAQAHLLPKPA